MKRPAILFAAIFSVALAGCDSGPDVVIQAAVPQGEASEVVALANLPVRLLPYNRDEIFDSLAAASAEPEPEVPAEIVQQQEEVRAAQTRWRQAEERWATVRDSLRTLGEQLRQMEQQGMRANPRYNAAFQQFRQLDAQVGGLDRTQQQAFQEFDRLQRGVISRSDSIRAVREAWADRTFEDFDEVVDARLESMGREEVADTTGPDGFTSFSVPNGQWWVYARYTLPYEELYWNVPVEVTGDSTVVQLTRETAEVRPVM